jgi:hypothetical protein
MTYSVKDIQEMYSVSQFTVLHWCATGQLKAINVGRDPGKKRARWRITESALRDFEASRATTPPPPKTRRRRKSNDDVIEFIK